ncbi:MAG: capsule assembly Wzi family protein [Planctomycetes bacterium]|nr:capsule assembly Wzi family protein [Planctomycetota bacterium]
MRRIAVCLILLAFLALSSAASVSTNVPLDHWSYDAVEKLADYGLIDSSMLTIKPLSRLEMARHVGQALDTLELGENVPEVLTAILDRLTREYRGELIQLGVLEGSYDKSGLKPLEDPYAKYLYATKRPDLENRRGDVFRRGSNYRAGFASRGTLWDTFAFYLHPEYAGAAEGDNDVHLIEGYGKVGLGPFELEAGRDSLWWGPGHHGAMIVSNNVRPFDLVKFSNAQPILLPWIFRVLGPVKGEWFLAQLEADRDYPHANLTGLRVNIKPHPWVELGVSRVSLFGGHGMAPLDFLDYFKPLVTPARYGEQGIAGTDQIAGFDGSLLIPLPNNGLLRTIKFYADVAGEDAGGFWPYKWGEIYGVKFNDILKTGRTDLRLEYANDVVPGYPYVWYTHSVYTSGYTYEGRVIGHHMGPESRDLFVQLSHYLSSDLIVDLAYDRHTHGYGNETITNIYEAGVTYFASRNWQVMGGYRFEQREDRGSDDNHIVEVGLIRRF